MAKDDDKESLLGLFSTRRSDGERNNSMLPTRSQGGVPITSTRPVVSRSSAAGKGVVTSRQGSYTPAEGNNSPWEAKSTANKQEYNYQGSTTNRAGGLSALANTILREARHELGTDAQLRGDSERQKNIKEETIVKAVDKVLQRRHEKLDDIERANIIIHLQKDLLG